MKILITGNRAYSFIKLEVTDCEQKATNRHY